MASKTILLFITTLLLAHAISTNVNRHNYNLVHRYSSSYENDWRPVSNQETIKFKPALPTKIWSHALPVYPDLKKIQEYLADTKLLNAQKHYEYKEIYPSKILENYNHFTHTNMELLPSETRKYSFLLPTNRDPFILSDNSFKSRTIKPNERDATPFYSNIPESFLVSEIPHPVRQHFFNANIKPSFPSADRSVVTFTNQNLNKHYPELPSVEFNNKFLKNVSVQQYYNRNAQHQGFQTHNQNFQNNFNVVNQTNSQKINKINDPNNLIEESPEKTYVTAFSRIKFKPSYQNYVIPSKVYTSSLLPMQVNYLHHYSNNVKKNHSDLHPEEYHSDNNSIENMYNIFRGTSMKNNKDLTYITSKYSNLTQKEANLRNTTLDTQLYLKRKVIPEQQIIQNKYTERPNIHLRPHNNNPFGLLTSTNLPLDQEFTKQTEILSKQNKQSEQQKELEVYERQEKIHKKKENLRYSGISDQFSPEKHNFGQEVELKNVLLSQYNPQNRNKSFAYYENVSSRLPVTYSYSVTTELPLVYSTATFSSMNDIQTGAYTTMQTMQTVSVGSEKKFDKVKNNRLVGKHRRRPQKPLTTTPNINFIALNKEPNIKFEANKQEHPVISTQIDTELIKNKSDSKIESVGKELASATENPTTIQEEFENKFAVTEGFTVDCTNLCLPIENNYEYVIDSTQSSTVRNMDYITEPLKLSTINNYENRHQIDNILTTIPTTVTNTFTTKYESKMLTTTSPTFAKTTSKIRFSRPLNTLRPRFSVKDYKSKLEDKNRKSYSSTTESNTENIHIKKKSSMDRKQFETIRDNIGRYKYMSRTPYRTSSTTPSTENQGNSTFTTQMRKKIHKYFPKERLNHNPLNISRTTPTSFNTAKLNSVVNSTFPAKSNYSFIGYHGELRTKLKANAPLSSKDEIEIVTSSNVANKNNMRVTPTQNSNSIKQNFNLYRFNHEPKVKNSETLEVVNNFPTLTNEQEDEVLLEKVSQSVADLTSSASSLHKKESLSKTMSQSSDKTVFLTHLKSTYDTPTLPIEAFFHDLTDIAN